jgi:hypothetical protein
MQYEGVCWLVVMFVCLYNTFINERDSNLYIMKLWRVTSIVYGGEVGFVNLVIGQCFKLKTKIHEAAPLW